MAVIQRWNKYPLSLGEGQGRGLFRIEVKSRIKTNMKQFGFAWDSSLRSEGRVV